MKCKACNRALQDSDYYMLPDNTLNNLCHTCILEVDKLLHPYKNALLGKDNETLLFTYERPVDEFEKLLHQKDPQRYEEDFNERYEID